MTTYHKRPFRPPRCGHCALPATWVVEGGVTNYYVGQFCDEHADKVIEAQEQYQARVRDLTQKATSR